MNAKQPITASFASGNTAIESLAAAHHREISRMLLVGIEACNLPAVLYRPDDTIAFMTPSFRELLDVQPDAATFADIVQHCYDASKGMVLTKPPSEWLAMAATKRRSCPHRTFEIDLVDRRWFIVNEACLDDGWVWSIYTDITSLKSNELSLRVAHDTARQDADTDALTGVFNRRHGLAELERQVRYYKNTGSVLTVALIDLDHFKQVNDTYGHQTGDAVLCHFVESASWLIRRSDTFARYGGEEFLLIMPGANAKDTDSILTRIREQLEKQPISDLDLRYTFSAGVASSVEVDDMESLLRRADTALYLAKRNGRNVTEIAPG
jgi:diguanylate cyclase